MTPTKTKCGDRKEGNEPLATIPVVKIQTETGASRAPLGGDGEGRR